MNELPFLPILTSYFSKRPEIIAAYIFGSRAEGFARPDSDVDLAVLLACLPGDTLKYRLDLMDETQKLLKLNTEVIILKEAPRLLQFQVIQKGKVVFERSPDKRAAFEMNVASRYYDYKRYFDYHAKQLAERIKGGGSVLDNSVILIRLAKLDEYVFRLRRFENIDLTDYLKDYDMQAIAERNLQLAIQVCIDIANYIVARKKMTFPFEQENVKFIEKN